MPFCTWDDEQTDKAVLNSGASTFPWYRSGIDIDPRSGEYVVRMVDLGADQSRTKLARFSRTRVRRVVSQVMMGRYDVAAEIRADLQADAIDADAMDCVLQIIVYGQLAFA